MRKYRVTHEDDPDDEDSDDEFKDDEADFGKDGKEPKQVRHPVYPSYLRPGAGPSFHRQDVDQGLGPLLAGQHEVGNRNAYDLTDRLGVGKNNLDFISEDLDEVTRMREVIGRLQSENEFLKSSSAAPNGTSRIGDVTLERKPAEEKERRMAIEVDNAVSKEMEEKVRYLERKLAEEKEKRREKEKDNSKLAKQLLESSSRRDDFENYNTVT